MKFIVLSEVVQGRFPSTRQKSFNAGHFLSIEPLDMGDERFFKPPEGAQTIITFTTVIDGHYDYIFVADHWENIVNRLVD